MGTAAIVGLILSAVLGAAGIGINAYQTKKANQAQREHDEAMAALNHRYREEEAASSFEREATFNQFASDTEKLRTAGLSPALMYGQYSGNSTPQVSSVGSSQSAGNVGRTFNASDFLGKLDPAEYTEQAIQRMNALTMKEKTASDVKLQNQLLLESASKTAENQRNTAFKKRLENIVYNQEEQMLNKMRTETQSAEWDLQFKRDTRDIQLEKLQLGNVELRKKIDYVVEQTKTEPVKRVQLRKEMEMLDASVLNYGANTKFVQEQTRSGQVGRIMQEFGLSARHFPANFRPQDIHHGPWQKQMQGAKLALEELGFTPFEATSAVLYYTCMDAKDVTPSAINGVSRILSAIAK